MNQQFSLRNFIFFKKTLTKKTQNIDLQQDINPISKYDKFLTMFCKSYYQNAASQQTVSCFKQFMSIYSETKCRLAIESIVSNLSQIKFLSMEIKKVYNLRQQLKISKQKKQQFRAYVIYGKAVNVFKKIMESKTQRITNTQDQTVKTDLTQTIQNCLIKMYQEKRLNFIKSQPHQIEDLILSHDLADNVLCPIIVTNQVFKLFVPVDAVLIMIVPEKQTPKSQSHSLIRSSLLHVYIDYANTFDKIMSKQVFFKNSTFKGIYFIEEGEIQVKSTRIVAKGWVISGKCKSSSIGWKFKPIPFFKFVLSNQNVWKQFTNDIKLNGQWPIKVQQILNLDEQYFQEFFNEQNMFKQGKQNKIKFPAISKFTKNFDIHKMSDMDRMRHFDEKMNQLYDYKQQILQRKIDRSQKSSLNQNQSLSNDSSQRQLNKKLDFLAKRFSLEKQNKQSQSHRYIKKNTAQQSSILIAGVLNKLRNIHLSTNENRSSEIKQSHHKIEHAKSKILGIKRYQQLLKNQKNHRYKGKNKYF